MPENQTEPNLLTKKFSLSVSLVRERESEREKMIFLIMYKNQYIYIYIYIEIVGFGTSDKMRKTSEIVDKPTN